MTRLAKMSRRTVLGGLAAGSAFAIAGRGTALAQQSTKLTFIEPFDIALEYIHEMNAAAGGHFKAQGLEIDIPNARGTSIAIQQVVAKQAAFSRVGALDLMKAVAAQNVPLVSIATSLHEAIFSLVSLKSAPINTPAELKGKTIGVASIGGGQENTLDLLLSSAGVAKADVPRQAIGSNVGNVELLKQGRVNGFFATVENTIALMRANEPIIAWSAGKFAPMPGGAIIARRDFAAENPAVIVKFLKALKASAEELLTADPNMILDRVEKAYEISSNKDRGFRIEAIKAYNAMAMSQGKDNLLKNVPEIWRKAGELTNAAGIVKVADADALYINQYINDAAKG
jgi:NitT/TauT family transport system substrate-binding protein